MPELPEVETVCRGLAPAMVGKRITKVDLRRKDLRFPFPKGLRATLTGATVSNIRRRAKYILADLEHGDTLIVHLGMTGCFTVDPIGSAQNPMKHDHVVFDLDDGTRIRFNDPRRFGLMDLSRTDNLAQHAFFEHLGPEPLGNGFSSAYLDEALAGRRTPIKSALLDQTTVAGLGNIYVCEALYRARISPRRSAATIPGQRSKRLAPVIRDVLTEAIEAGGSTLRDYAHTDGELGYFQHAFSVYDREGDRCLTPLCNAQIKRIVQSGRSTFFCSNCQR